ncbi:endogenous retrovirus group K member 8 Rec protein-like isoform X2 [Pongo pygmaeus]|uniref:endogenous retrovirus group K member 8 Rec protein-like isoform X2 n=1 Tax=Pongo pygmaeus TaxID=9600 RepID=UPI0023E2EC58|nr:endogenous retrovirus group K member 8 Rec protein-like isoform X2 [Pongo pygmaeus]
MTDQGRPSTFSLQALREAGRSENSRERISLLSGYPQDILSCAMSQSPTKRKRPRNVSAPPVRQTAQMNISVEQMETSKTPQATPPTWGQMKRLAHIAEENLRSQNKPLTTSNLMVAMMVEISLVSTDADGALGEKPDTVNEIAMAVINLKKINRAGRGGSHL